MITPVKSGSLAGFPIKFHHCFYQQIRRQINECEHMEV